VPVSASLISIALVTRNGASTLPALLDALACQRTDSPMEIVAVDSGSTDGTIDLLARAGARVTTIAPEAFNHGLTRNLVVEQARGELVVMLVQDAIPHSESWLEALTTPLLKDARVAATFARQRPRADASAITREYLRRGLVASETPRTLLPLTREALGALPPMDRLLRCTFDDVCSCIRRSVWAAIPFRETPIGEDVEWARDVLLAGHRIEFVPSAVVVHSHERSAGYEFDRTRALHARLFDLFGLQTIPTLPLLARAIASSLVLHARLERGRPGSFWRGVGLAIAWPAGQYLGARASMRRVHG
jgi:rhamnosyltransferase